MRLMHRAVLTISAGLALGPLAACQNESQAELIWEATTDTIGDTIAVRTTSGSEWGSAASLSLEMSIGSMDGDDHFVLGDPVSLAVTGDGIIVVLDEQIPIVRAFAADGTFIGNIGRDGRGPGEYDGPDAVAVMSDGRILVRDPGNSRISVFDVGGTLLDEWRLSGGFNTNRRFYVDTLDHSYANTLLERGLGPWDWEFGLVRYAPNGEILDTIPAPVWSYDRAQVTASREGSSSVRAVPFTPEPHWSFSPHGHMVGGLSTDYRIDLFRQDGTVIRMEKEWEPVPVGRAEADERRLRITRSLQRQYGSWRWNGPSIPDTKPPFRGLFVSWEGNVWVTRSTGALRRPGDTDAEPGDVPELEFFEPPAFDVFSATGRFMGRVNAPSNMLLDPEPVVRGDHLWAITQDDIGVPYIARFRVTRGS